MKTLCDNVKATGVTIYKVQIDTDGAGQSAVLPYCASGTSNPDMLTQPSQIASVFFPNRHADCEAACREVTCSVGEEKKG
jgi:hypothetical protein